MSDSTTIEVAGLSFEVEDVYAEGHVVTENEARALNQTRRENLRNNFRKTAKDELEKGTSASKIADMFAEYAESYEFSAKRQARAPRDPVEAEARKIARKVVTGALRKQNIDIKSLEDGKMDELVSAYAAKDEVRALAQETVDALQSIATDALEAVG
jgi:hypothetical protein